MENNIIYVVTSGCYSDYSIRAIFSTKEKAEKYIAEGIKAEEFSNPAEDTYNAANIEEYTLDLNENYIAQKVWQCGILINSGEIYNYGNIPDPVSEGFVLALPFRGRSRNSTSTNYGKDFIHWVESTVSREHCLKVAAEERQRVLRERG